MSVQRQRKKCHNCRRWFIPNPRSQYHQRYCSKPNCRRASKAESQKQWHTKPANRHYWCGAKEVERVRQWRKAHPDYWRRYYRKKRLRYKMT